MFVGKVVAIVDFVSFISLLLSSFVDVLSSAVEAKRYHIRGIEVRDTVPIKKINHVCYTKVEKIYRACIA